MDFSIENLKGKKYNRLTIIGETDRHIEPNGKKQRVMICECDCGSVKNKFLKDLRSGLAKSCGCLHKEQKLNIIENNRYGMLTIIKEANSYISPKGKKSRKVSCQCECGNTKDILLHSLRTGKVKNCGCTNKVLTEQELNRKVIYSRFKGIKKRCYNTKDKSYHRYGGRGITICKEWDEDFKKFYEWSLSNGFKKELQIDRIDNDGNYEPDNCRWVTPKENSNNKKSPHF